MAKNSPDTESSRVIKFEVPKFLTVAKGLTPKSSNQILVVLLVIAAFLIGALGQYAFQFVKPTNSQAGLPSTAGTAAENQAAPSPIPPGTKINVENGHLPVKGNENARVTIIEFSDFECPFCEQFFTQTLDKLTADYIDTGKVKFYYRHFPLGFHPAAKPAALASECANDQDKFWEYHDKIFTEQSKIAGGGQTATDALKQFAQDLGLNTAEFNQCFDSAKYEDQVSKDMADGQKAGVTGTPTFYVNGLQLVGAQPYESFKTLIDQEIEKAK